MRKGDWVELARKGEDSWEENSVFTEERRRVSVDGALRAPCESKRAKRAHKAPNVAQKPSAKHTKTTQKVVSRPFSRQFFVFFVSFVNQISLPPITACGIIFSSAIR
jgi:hypothetical protein